MPLTTSIRHVRTRFSLLFAALAALLVVAIGSCRDPMSPRPQRVSLSLSPSFAIAAAGSGRPINRIRVTAADAETHAVLAQKDTAVDPNATAWTIDLSVPLAGRSTASVVATVELLNDPGSPAQPTVEFSGTTPSLAIETGKTTLASGVPLGCGPLANQSVTSFKITAPPATLVEGDSVTLAATTAGATGTAVPIWGSVDAAVASVDVSGKVKTLRDGVARIAGCAGTKADTVSVTVSARPGSVTIVPDTILLTSIDATGTFTATVKDPRGAPLPNATVQWSSGDQGVTTSVGNGTFKAVANGRTTVTATVAGAPTVTGTGIVRVAQAAASVKVTPTAVTIATVGGTTTLSAAVLDANAHPVANATPAWTSRSTSIATVDATGKVTGVAIGAAYVVASVGTLADSSLVTVARPAVSLAIQGADKVSLGHTGTIAVTLNKAAPAGGVTVTVTSGTPSVLSIVPPGTVTLAAGGTTGTVTVNGLAEGTSMLTATATGYDDGTLTVGVEPRLISLPRNFSVPYGQSAPIPISIARPAPAGGTAITLQSRDATTVGVTTQTVTIPAGATSANGTLAGVNPGTALIVATNPLYDGDSVNVTSAASLNITAGSVGLNASFGSPITIRFESNGVPVPAPSPGVVVSLVALDPGCVSVPAQATILTGLVTVDVPLAYGGTTATTCTTRVRATATNIAPDSVTATVNPVPPIQLSGATLGNGLQRAISGSLGASNHGGVKIHLSSPSQSLLLAPDASTVGTSSLDINMLSGSTFFTFVVQAVEGGPLGNVVVTATAPGFAVDTAQINVVQPGVDLTSLQQSINTLDPDNPFQARVGVPNGQHTGVQEAQALRAGAAPITATLQSSAPAVGTLVTSAGTNAVRTVQIAPSQSTSPFGVTNGGVAHHPLSNGSTVISVTSPGYISTNPGGQIVVQVTTPSITVSPATFNVGAGLMKNLSGSLGASNHGGDTVYIVSTDSSRALISPNASTVGTGSIAIPIPVSGTFFSFWIHGVEQATGGVPFTVTARGFTSTQFTATVVQPAYDVGSLRTQISTLDADNVFNVRVGITSSPTNLAFINEYQVVRTGAQPLVATIRSNNSAVGVLKTSPTDAGGPTATVQIPAGQSQSSFSLTTGGVAHRPKSPGTTSIITTIPGYLGTTGLGNGDSIPVLVTAPNINIGTITVGAGLMRSMSGSLSATNHGGVTVHLTSTNPQVALLAKDLTSAAAPTLDIPLNDGNGFLPIVVHGVEGQAGAVRITATAPGFTDTAFTATVVTPAFDISGLSTSIVTFSGDRQFVVRVGVPNSATPPTFLVEPQPLRFGATPLAVTVTSSISAVGGLVTSSSSTPSATASIQIGAGQSQTPTPVSANGVAFRALTNGTTTVSANIPGYVATVNPSSGGAGVGITVSPPTISVTTANVGSGLQRPFTVSLGAAQHGGTTVTITTSQPTVALVSPDAITPGTSSISVSVPNGGSIVSFYVQGIAGQTGVPTITAAAPGFSQGVGTATIVQAAVAVVGLSSPQTAGGAENTFEVQVGLANGQLTGFTETQAVRAGGGALTATVSSSDPTVGTVKLLGGAGSGTVSVSIAEGQSTSPFSGAGTARFTPLAAGTTRVSPSITGFLQTIDATFTPGQLVTVNPAPAPNVAPLPPARPPSR